LLKRISPDPGSASVVLVSNVYLYPGIAPSSPEGTKEINILSSAAKLPELSNIMN